ncbi:MAG: LysR family transcriptional regulator, partial [Treponema sp.]|nr:LysR family transcriptional regulator [Treponema sp.]
MTLQQLKYAVAVADCLNMTEAAKKVFISQPSLTAA